MTRARGQSPRSMLNRELPHQVLVLSDSIRGSRIQLCNGLSRRGWRAGKELHGPQRRQVVSALLLCRAEKRGGVSVGVRRRVTRPILKDYVSLRLSKAKRLGIPAGSGCPFSLAT